MNVFRMNDEFQEEAAALQFPQFMMEIGASLFSDNEYVLLEQEHLCKGFTLKDKDVQIDFTTLDAEMARVDIDDSKEATPKAWKLVGAHQAKMFQLWLEQGKLVCHPNFTLKSTISPTDATSVIPKSLYTSEEDMNDYERKMVWALSSMPNIKWWHRNISKRGFMINGSTHAYPDIMIRF